MVSKPGPPSLDDLMGRLDHALKHVDNRIELNRNPLTRLSTIARLAESRYEGRLHPRALALREIVGEAVRWVLAELDGESSLRYVHQFLTMYSSGSSVAEASRQLGLSREHCSRSIKREALRLVAQRFAELTWGRNLKGSLKSTATI